MELRGFTYSYPGKKTPVLRSVTFDVRPGECHVITGPTGSGKSTLALALKGMLPSQHDGSRPHGCCDVGVVLQNPQTQLLASTAGAEVGFGLENLCVEPDMMPGMVRHALERTGLIKPLSADLRRFSMGEKYRLLIAAQLVMGRRLIVLDEPSGQLDAQGLADLVALIGRLKRDGVSFVVCEHKVACYKAEADAMWTMEDGALSPMTEQGLPQEMQVHRPGGYAASGETLVRADGIGLSCDGGTEHVWKDVDIEVSSGMRVAICGPNGAGKTSLLRCMSGMLRAGRGKLSVLGGRPSLQRLRGRVGLMMQDPDAQLFEDTVEDEVSFTMRRLGYDKHEARRRAGDTLGRLGISGLSGRAPHRLSYGQKRLVCMASVMAAGPELLMLDAPLTGLDLDRRTAMLDALSKYADAGGAVIATSHDPQELSGWADAGYALGGGTIVAEVA